MYNSFHRWQDLDPNELDRQAAAAASRAKRDDHHLERTRAALGVGVPTRELRCGFCSYLLRRFDHDVYSYATIRLPLNEAPQWGLPPHGIPKPSRPYRTVRCRHCKRTTVYVLA